MFIETGGLNFTGFNSQISYSGELMNMMAEKVSPKEYFDGFSKMAEDIATTAFFCDKKGTTFTPKIWEYKQIKIEQDMPYAQNISIGSIEGGKVVTKTTYMQLDKFRAKISPNYFSEGVFIQNPIHLILSGYLTEAYFSCLIKFRKLDAIQKKRAEQGRDEAKLERDQLLDSSPMMYAFPEVVISASKEHTFMLSSVQTPWLLGLGQATMADLPSNHQTFLRKYMEGQFLVTKLGLGWTESNEQLKSELSKFGLNYEYKGNWVTIPKGGYVTRNITPEMSRYIENYPNQILSLLPLLLKNTYMGGEMSEEELGANVVTFGKLMKKLFLSHKKIDPQASVDSYYELVAHVFQNVSETDTLSIDVKDIMMFAHMMDYKQGFISVVPHSEITSNQENELFKLVSKNLVNLYQISSLGCTYHAPSGVYTTTKDGTSVKFKISTDPSVLGRGDIHKLITRQTRATCDDMFEFIEEVIYLYNILLDSTLTRSQIISDGKITVKLSTTALTAQVHFGFVGLDPVIMLSKRDIE